MRYLDRFIDEEFARQQNQRDKGPLSDEWRELEQQAAERRALENEPLQLNS